MSDNKQPTNEELSLAWSHAIQCEGVAGWVPLMELKAMRDRRTTWFGTEEILLRRSLDQYLIWRGAQ